MLDRRPTPVQLTLPAGVSALLHVGPGDEIRFEVTPEGVMVTPIPVRERLAPLIGRYRKGRGKTLEEQGRGIMADFLIGAHARSVGSLVTNDAAFFRREFPDLEVVEVRRP